MKSPQARSITPFVSLCPARRRFRSPRLALRRREHQHVAPPMGARLRLKASFDISAYSAANQVILNAMKKYGLILADNGSTMYISGTPDDRWNNADLHLLDGATADDFDVLTLSPLYTNSNIPTGPNPTISSFTPSATTISSGTAVTLSWHVTNTDYIIISPTVGATRATSVSVSPPPPPPTPSTPQRQRPNHL